jgi:hypothetical protein
VTLTDPDAPTERTIVRYRNQAGALVTITEKQGTPGALNPAQTQTRYSTACEGCLEALFGSPTELTSARDWASKHAERCRALPQPETDQQ